MNYSENPGHVHVALFRTDENGALRKWGYDIAVNMEPYYFEPLIHDAFKKALDDFFSPNNPTRSVTGFEGEAICLEPYHKYAHPISLTINYPYTEKIKNE